MDDQTKTLTVNTIHNTRASDANGKSVQSSVERFGLYNAFFGGNKQKGQHGG